MAGNQNSGAVKHPLAPTMRYAFIKALDIRCETEGKTLPELVAGEIEEHGLLTVMSSMSKYIERESNVTVNANHTHEHVSESVAWLEQAIGESQGIETPVAGEERPILPH